MGYFHMSRPVESIFGAVVTAPHQIPYTYTAVGGETSISLPVFPVTGLVTIGGGVQVPLDNYEIEGNVLHLGGPLDPGDVVYCLFDKVLSPEGQNSTTRIYKFKSVGGETSFTPDFTSYGVQSLYIDGKYQTPIDDYTYNKETGVVNLASAIVGAGEWVVAELYVQQNYPALAAPDGADMIGAQQPFPGSVYRTVQDKFREVVSIKDFGGNGDGSTINDTAFQKAMSLAETKPISLYIPPGIFKITETQALSLSGDISFKMFGAGSGTSVILVETGGDGFIFNTPGNYSLWKTGPGRTTIELSGLSIATTQALVGVGITINGNHVTGRPSATIIFNDVNVTSYSGASGQFFDTGIMLCNCSNVIFNNVHMYLGSGNTTSKGVYSFSESISNGGGALHFTDCTFLFGGNQIWVGDQQEGVYLTNCEFVGGSVAVRYEPSTAQSGLHIMGGHMNSKDYNIYIHRLYHFEIIGGLYFNSNTNPAFTHIYCDVVNKFTISGNVFNGVNGASERGIHIGALVDNPGFGGVISGNMFADLNIGVSLSSSANNVKESANLYRNCTTNISNASAAGNNILEYSQYHSSNVLTLVGGATSETVHIILAGAVFKKKPVSAIMNCLSNSGMVGFYDYTNSTTTDLVFIIRRIDEAIIPANSYRFSISAFGTP